MAMGISGLGPPLTWGYWLNHIIMDHVFKASDKSLDWVSELGIFGFNTSTVPSINFDSVQQPLYIDFWAREQVIKLTGGMPLNQISALYVIEPYIQFRIIVSHRLCIRVGSTSLTPALETGGMLLICARFRAVSTSHFRVIVSELRKTSINWVF